MQRGNGWEQNCAYGLLRGGREGTLHTNECVMSTLHQCVIQWIGDEVDVVQADEEVCVAVAESMFTS
jgi:hypothetical protein